MSLSISAFHDPTTQRRIRSQSHRHAYDLENELRDTAIRIRQRTVQCLLDNGRDLLRARDRLAHGLFRKFVEDECGLTVRVAQMAMRAAKYADTSGKHEIISQLPPTVQYLITAPSVPEPVREQVFDAFGSGGHLKVDEVKQLIRAARGERPRQARKGGAVGHGDSEVAGPEASPGTVTEGDTIPPSVMPVDSSTDGTAEASTDVKLGARTSATLSLHRLDTTTKDPEKRDHIKKIYAIVRQLSQPNRGNLVCHLAKQGDLPAAKLADCLL